MMMESSRVLTCVYCGTEYPQDTPAWGDKVLTDHIKICEKHPMRDAERKIKLLREALVGLVGVDGKDELDEMEATLRLLMNQGAAPKDDIIKSIDAINALRETLDDEATYEPV